MRKTTNSVLIRCNFIKYFQPGNIDSKTNIGKHDVIIKITDHAISMITMATAGAEY